MKVQITDEESERYNQIGVLSYIDHLKNNLKMYNIKFDDGESAGFLAYQIEYI